MAAVELAPGTVIGARYRLERLLGEGGMGAVWAVEDTASGQRCALKLMKDPAGDLEARRRFLREGRSAAAVRHPNVVRILEVLEPEGEPPAIVMELLEGESLRARLWRVQRLTVRELAGIMAPVVSAIGAAHALGIVHRDLKPENIFLARGADGEIAVKVLDFGIAKLTALDGEAMRSTGITTGVVLGTPAYMAPEQVFAERDLDHRADIWALGIILYECLAGVCPTEGDNVGQVLKHVVSKPFAPLREIVPDVPEEVSRLVARMLERERSQRPADLHEVLESLAPFGGAPGAAFGAPAPRRVSAEELAATAPQGPRARGRERERDIDPLAKTAHAAAPARDDASVLVASPPSPPLPPPPRSRRRSRAVLASVATAVVIGGIAAGSWWPASRSTPSTSAVASSPLDAADAKIACPILRASGVETPAGWLGAAAAAVACERARVLLGGRPERMLVPAELLDLPRTPVDAFPSDPYDRPDARARSVEAARQRAQAYLDGEVTWSSAGYTVALSLHRADGAELGRAPGRGRGLYEAVRSAMSSLVGPGLIPKARELEPDIAAWTRTKDVDDALAVVDLTFAFSHNAGGLADECRRFQALSARIGELGQEGRWLCAYTFGQPLPEVALADADRSAAAIATRIRINHIVHRTQDPADVKLVRELFDREGTPRGRSLLAALETCLLGSSRLAHERAIVAVQSEPTNPEGSWCNPWDVLMVEERNTTGTDSAVRAMQAWVPWSSYAWWELGYRSEGRSPAALPLLWRAHRLSPFDAQIADTLADSLLAAGDRRAARGLAAELRAGGVPLHEVASDLILVRVDASEARFGEALERARKLAEPSPGDTGWIRAQRLESAAHALELAVLLGRDREIAEVLVKQLVDPDPSPLDGTAPFVPLLVPAICVRASAPPRCLERYRSLRRQIIMVTDETDAFLIGVERYVLGDLPGAAKAWRPLLGGRMAQASMLPDAMVRAFERTGATELAEQVDDEVMKRAGEFNGATLGHVRAAYRARDRGDPARARQLAAQVIQAWGRADEEPPAVAEMRRLVAQLAKR